jgi:hypothetical protein
MKRRRLKLSLLLIALLLGAIVNVAVAWGLWRFSPVQSTMNGFSEFGYQGVGWYYQEGTRILPWTEQEALDQFSVQHYAFVHAGWPRRSLKNERLYVNIGDSRRVSLHPAFPLWPGFAINTIFYAAILWMPKCVESFAAGAGCVPHARTRSAPRQSAPNAASP